MKTAALGIQHVLAMYAGAILVPLIVGDALGLTTEQLTYLVAIDIFMCGIATLITMILVAMVSLVESTGVYFAVSDITDKKLTENDLAKGYRAEGLAILFGGIFNAFQYTA